MKNIVHIFLSHVRNVHICSVRIIAVQSPCFNLTPKGCLILASGYDAVLREKLLTDWNTSKMRKNNPNN